MKKINLWALAAILTICGVFVSCTDAIDNPVTPGPSPDNEPSAVDEGTWHMDDKHMDKTVGAGNDFFLYCNGGYWNNTVLDATTMLKQLLSDQASFQMEEAEALLTLPVRDKMMEDVDKRDEATVAAQWAKLQAAIDRVNAVTTKEEIWKLQAQLTMEGYYTQAVPTLFSYKGRLGVVLGSPAGKDYESVGVKAKDNLAWQLANNPDLLAHVHPVKEAGTRGFDRDKWPMLVTFFETLGVPLDDVFAVDAFMDVNYPDQAESTLKDWLAVQDRSLEVWKDNLISALQEDAVFFDSKVRDKKNTKESVYAMISNFSRRYLNYETAHAYAKAHITDEMKQRTRDYCEQLRQTFRERIEQNVWMSAASKQNALDKLNAMAFNIGAPDTWYQEGFADLSQTKTILDDILAARQAQMKLTLKLIGKSTAAEGFHLSYLIMNLLEVNAFYLRNFNSINIFPAWMMKPYYDPQQNEAHNYAAMMVFGHEMTHGFDDVGAKYNKLGDLGAIWGSDADSKEFDKRTKQIIDYYSSFDIIPAEVGLKCDGKFTSGENIADLGGFLLAYDTYLKHLKDRGFKGEQLRLQQQRFYQAYAYLWCSKWTADFARIITVGEGEEQAGKDGHALYRERINGVVANTPDWYNLFGVKPTDKLYRAPEDRITIW